MERTTTRKSTGTRGKWSIQGAHFLVQASVKCAKQRSYIRLYSRLAPYLIASAARASRSNVVNTLTVSGCQGLAHTPSYFRLHYGRCAYPAYPSWSRLALVRSTRAARSASAGYSTLSKVSPWAGATATADERAWAFATSVSHR